MAVRRCPLCQALVPAGHALAYSNNLECPGCKKRLIVSDASRYLATLAGLLAAVLAWRLSRVPPGMLGWVLPVVISFLAYSFVAPFTLALLADLHLKPEEPEASAGSVHEPSVHGHAGSHR